MPSPETCNSTGRSQGTRLPTPESGNGVHLLSGTDLGLCITDLSLLPFAFRRRRRTCTPGLYAACHQRRRIATNTAHYRHLTCCLFATTAPCCAANRPALLPSIVHTSPAWARLQTNSNNTALGRRRSQATAPHDSSTLSAKEGTGRDAMAIYDRYLKLRIIITKVAHTRRD